MTCTSIFLKSCLKTHTIRLPQVFRKETHIDGAPLVSGRSPGDEDIGLWKDSRLGGDWSIYRVDLMYEEEKHIRCLGVVLKKNRWTGGHGFLITLQTRGSVLV